jgi:hypothetical protein
MRSWDRVEQWRPVDEWESGFGWSQDEFMRRTSHALAAGGRVWLIDPVDTPELEERLGVPHLRAWESLGTAPFEALPVRRRRWWREVALWEPAARTLVCADALGTVAYFCAPGERIGLHPLVRPFPPRALAQVAPARILCGHGAGVHEGATAALQEALQTARRRLPAAWLRLVKGFRRAGREVASGGETER